MKFAYADPPYIGQATRHYGKDAREVNHPLLIRHLMDEYPDGWALSSSEPGMHVLIPILNSICGAEEIGVSSRYRVCAWVKPFCSWKPNQRVPYAWEPVFVYGGRQKGGRGIPSVRDYVSANITTQKGVHGAKPPAFWWWLFAVLGVEESDTIDDLFPGSCGGSRELAAYRQYQEGLGIK